MRPVLRGVSPRAMDFDNYEAAKPFLVSRLGLYCSYCERRVATGLAVEHIQAKGLPAYSHLIGRWENFLLACNNCNGFKGDKDVNLAKVLLPDRDNTLLALQYHEDGTVTVSSFAKKAGLANEAEALLALVGLDRMGINVKDENDKLVALDRIAQRMEVWETAYELRRDIVANPSNTALHKAVIKTAKGYGFFSIWYAVFSAYPEIIKLLINAFPGTRESGCFDMLTYHPVSPSSNPDDLVFGGKV